MVVARSHIGHQRAERIEWCPVAFFDLPVHIFADFMHRHVSRSFDKRLYVFRPCPLYQFAHGIQFSKLCSVVGIEYRSGAQSVA